MKVKTTPSLDASLVALLKREAGRQGKTTSEIVESALRLLLQPRPHPPELPPVPTFDGHALVDIADREGLYKAMEGY